MTGLTRRAALKPGKPLARHTPLRAATRPLEQPSGWPAGTSKPPRKPRKPLAARKPRERKPAKDTGPSRKVRKLVLARDDWRCVGCGRNIGGTYTWWSLQHRKARGVGGDNSPCNLIVLCGSATSPGCHRLCEDRDREAHERGLWLRSDEDPATSPVMVFRPGGSGMTMWPTADGFWVPEAPAGALDASLRARWRERCGHGPANSHRANSQHRHRAPALRAVPCTGAATPRRRHRPVLHLPAQSDRSLPGPGQSAPCRDGHGPQEVPRGEVMSNLHYSSDCDEYHGLVRDFPDVRPPIVCLCGSTRFYDEFRKANLRLTLAGEIVLSIGCDTKSDADLAATAELGHDLTGAKVRLDELHKRKIDLADYVLVLNVGGYIGESTRGEIRYAEAHGKPVRYLERAVEDQPVKAGA